MSTSLKTGEKQAWRKSVFEHSFKAIHVFSSFKTLPSSIIARFLSAFDKWFRIRNMRRVGSGCSWVFWSSSVTREGQTSSWHNLGRFSMPRRGAHPNTVENSLFWLELICFIFWLHFTINKSLFRLRLNLRPQNYSRMEGHITFSQVFRLIFFKFFHFLREIPFIVWVPEVSIAWVIYYKYSKEPLAKKYQGHVLWSRGL